MTDNRELVADFARIFYAERDPRTAFARYVASAYVQHNPGLPDGPEAAVEALEPTFQAVGARFEVQRLLVDGDLAVVHVRASRPGAPDTAVADFYRIAEGRIVEHWDVLQPVPATSANAHPMF
ncbi:nuclear transport factor 2 family protein [Amnibacterium sp. CER49]|uniref:nuclear transport factor 2 family protein n=1 Tax=Amnibacterium sp. CER49 TaxID=3039161 RepID=UPI00244D4651|nr:nuclear transport factor 2 family protein [Amnibacterium sp. CER49]MDH2444865.1 nuclear transport factor 2 family protein [Amnibacterium sp. CER49]